MLDFIKDLLGINRYVVRYDFPSRSVQGAQVQGAWGPYHKFFAESRAEIGEKYSIGTYVVERYDPSAHSVERA